MKLLGIILLMGAIQAQAKTITCESATRAAAGNIKVEIDDGGKTNVLANFWDYLNNEQLTDYKLVGYQVVEEPVEGELILFGFSEFNLVDENGVDASITVQEEIGGIQSRVPCHVGRTIDPVCNTSLFKKTKINMLYGNGKKIQMSCF